MPWGEAKETSASLLGNPLPVLTYLHPQDNSHRRICRMCTIDTLSFLRCNNEALHNGGIRHSWISENDQASARAVEAVRLWHNRPWNDRVPPDCGRPWRCLGDRDRGLSHRS